MTFGMTFAHKITNFPSRLHPSGIRFKCESPFSPSREGISKHPLLVLPYTPQRTHMPHRAVVSAVRCVSQSLSNGRVLCILIDWLISCCKSWSWVVVVPAGRRRTRPPCCGRAAAWAAGAATACAAGAAPRAPPAPRSHTGTSGSSPPQTPASTARE